MSSHPASSNFGATGSGAGKTPGSASARDAGIPVDAGAVPGAAPAASAAPATPGRVINVTDRAMLEDNIIKRWLRFRLNTAFEQWQEFTRKERILEEQRKIWRIISDARNAMISSKPGERPPKDMKSLEEWAYNIQGKTFKHIDTRAVQDVLMNMEFTTYRDGDLIFLQGDFGTHYYILFSGNVAIFAGAPQSSLTELKANRAAAIKNRDLKSEYLGVRVATVPSGSGFGEVALFEDGIRRTASAVADGDVEMIAVPKVLYRRSFAPYHVEAMEQSEKVIFLSKCRFFKGWAHHRYITLAKVLVKRKFLIGETIIEQGESHPNIYFIKTGEVKIVKTIVDEGGEDSDDDNRDSHPSGSSGASSGALGSSSRKDGANQSSGDRRLHIRDTLNNTSGPAGSSSGATKGVASGAGFGGANTNGGNGNNANNSKAKPVVRKLDIIILCAGDVIGTEILAQAGLPMEYSVVGASQEVETFMLASADLKQFSVAAKGTNTLRVLIEWCKARLLRGHERVGYLESVVKSVNEILNNKELNEVTSDAMLGGDESSGRAVPSSGGRKLQKKSKKETDPSKDKNQSSPLLFHGLGLHQRVNVDEIEKLMSQDRSSYTHLQHGEEELVRPKSADLGTYRRAFESSILQSRSENSTTTSPVVKKMFADSNLGDVAEKLRQAQQRNSSPPRLVTVHSPSVSLPPSSSITEEPSVESTAPTFSSTDRAPLRLVSLAYTSAYSSSTPSPSMWTHHEGGGYVSNGSSPASKAHTGVFTTDDLRTLECLERSLKKAVSPLKMPGPQAQAPPSPAKRSAWFSPAVPGANSTAGREDARPPSPSSPSAVESFLDNRTPVGKHGASKNASGNAQKALPRSGKAAAKKGFESSSPSARNADLLKKQAEQNPMLLVSSKLEGIR